MTNRFLKRDEPCRLRDTGLALLLLLAAGPTPPTEPELAARLAPTLPGACYCKAVETLECTANLTEAECRRRSTEALCDEWFWLERLGCWNWGYGG
jgi:hypothetical protein